MREDSSSYEMRLIRDELVRERVWAASDEAQTMRLLAERLFEVAAATDAWGTRAAERWIATNEHNLSSRLLADLLARVGAIEQLVNADFS